jgi:hypothetical protein
VPVVGPRFLLEAGFIIAVAVVAGIKRLDTVWIVVVMGVAWLLVAVLEIVLSRRRSHGRAAEPQREPQAPAPPVEPVAVAPAPAPVVPVPEPDPQPEPEHEPEPERPQLVAVATPPHLEPDPEPEAEPEPEPTAEPATAAASVIPLTPAFDGPREWNLWELERVARDHAGSDVARDEERSYLLMYLREFADPDGLLPADFDGLVRDAFGDLLQTVAS